MNLKALIAEFIGTFALIFVGCSAIVMNHYTDGQVGLIGIALAHGLTIAVFASAFGHVSGGHFNPAVTLAFLAVGKVKIVEALGYILAQFLGAFAGAALMVFGTPENSRINTFFGVPNLAKEVAAEAGNTGERLVAVAGVNMTQGIVLEAVATMFLLLVIFGTAIDRRAPRLGGLFIGLTITLNIFAIGPLTGAAMNPARFFGPALVSSQFENALVYVIGPVVGALVAALLYQFVIAPKADQELSATA